MGTSALSLQITPPHPTLYEPFTSRTANVIRSASRPASIRRLSSAGSRLWPGLPSTGSTTTWRLPSTPRRLRWPSATVWRTTRRLWWTSRSIPPTSSTRRLRSSPRWLPAAAATMGSSTSHALSQRSDGQIRALAHHWQQKYHNGLEKVIESEFSGHMKDALLLMVRRACDRIMSDAVQLEDAMAGFGTKDVLLVQRVVRVHWD